MICFFIHTHFVRSDEIKAIKRLKGSAISCLVKIWRETRLVF